ncbi:Oxygenase domain [Trypanosoma vivax]|nr:Bifunctional helicase and thymine dioxygenase JBP2 [Trypanosoma vivax]KAH8613841.1 Oxygenase domain [Trypanosoma vivax]
MTSTCTRVSVETLREVLRTVLITGDPTIISPSAFWGELDTVVGEVKRHGMSLAAVPRDSITVMPPIPLSDFDLYKFCARYCAATTSEQRLEVRNQIRNHSYSIRTSELALPHQQLYHPSDYALRIVKFCARLILSSEEEYQRACVVAPLLHINPVQSICAELRSLRKAGLLTTSDPSHRVALTDTPDVVSSALDQITEGPVTYADELQLDQEHETDMDFTGHEVVDSVEGPVAEYLSEKDFELVNETCTVYDESGERLLAAFVRGGIEKKICRQAAAAVEDAATTQNMRKATNGGKVNPETGIVGFYDYLNNPTQHKCRETEFTRKNWRAIAQPCEAFLTSLDKLYDKYAPVHYKQQRIAIPPAYMLFDTVFSTLTVNRNFRTAVHRDSGDFRSGLAALCVVDGEFDGCHLAIKELGKAFQLSVGDVLFFDSALEHGNTEVHNPEGQWKRISVVCYLRCGLLSHACEVEDRRRLSKSLGLQKLLRSGKDSVVNLNDSNHPPLYVPCGMVEVLSMVQQAALRFIVNRLGRGSGCVVALTMGLGKTLVSLATCFSHLHGSDPRDILIVTPKIVLQHWIAEREKWKGYGLVLPEFIVPNQAGCTQNEYILKSCGQRSCGKASRTGNIFLVNPEYIRTFIKKFNRFRPSLMIIDEGHCVSSKGNKLRSALESMQCPSRVILSGTPVQNNADELYRLVGWVDKDVHAVLPPRSFSELSGAINRYINGDDSYLGAAVSAQRYIQEWMSPYVFSVMGTDLPPLHDYLIVCSYSNVQHKMFEDHFPKSADGLSSLKASEHRPYHLSTHPLCFLGFISGLYKSFNGSHKGTSEFKLEEKEGESRSYALNEDEYELIDYCLQLVSRGCLNEFVNLSGKLTALISIMQAVCNKGEKALIFSQYVGSQDFISKTLTAFNIPSALLRGRDCNSRRQTTMKAFRDDENIVCLVLSTPIGAYGLDFTAANHIILWDSWWNPQVEAQAIARAYRRNQSKSVVAYRLASEYEDTIVLKTQARKRALFQCLMSEQTTQAVPQRDLTDYVNREEDSDRKKIWLSLKSSTLEGGTPAVSRIIRYSDTLRTETWR